jgi:very-short-patch-repair endonuclease
VFKSTSNIKYNFDCIECGHVFEACTYDVTNKHNWCPFCSSHRICEEKNCDHCFNKSFASHEKAIYWSPENILQPRHIFKVSDYEAIFDCVCGHTFKSIIANIPNGNNLCPYCAYPPKQLCDNDSCDECFEKSFASVKMSKFWSNSNEKKPREIFKCGHSQKYIFDCPNCNKIYESYASNVTHGSWCDCTRNKTETKLFDFLKSSYDFKIEKQKKFEWCKNKNCLPFDFCIEKFKLLIELDGPQHFFQISNWPDPITTQQNDKFKMKCANDNEYSVVRIMQIDVWSDKNDWKNNIINSIKKYDNPTNVFFGDCYKKEW